MITKYLLIVVLVTVTQTVIAGELPTPNDFGGNFSFPSTTGTNQEISALKGKLVILNFGFTSCPDVCPMVLAKLVAVQKAVDPKLEKLQVVFVTVDPQRDSLEKLKEYLPRFHQSFIGLRAENIEEVKAVLKQYGGFVNSQSDDDGRKEISHTDYVYIIDRKGYVAGFYDVKSAYQELLDLVNKLI